jgi:hypothetical protein
MFCWMYVTYIHPTTVSPLATMVLVGPVQSDGCLAVTMKGARNLTTVGIQAILFHIQAHP